MKARFPSRNALLPILIISLLAAGCDLWNTGGTGRRDSTVPPGQPAMPTIDAGGGMGTVGTGGDADQEWGIYLESNGPLGIRILREGVADASFTPDIPTVTANLGSEPWIVAGDTVVSLAATPESQGIGTHYFLQGDSNLYHKVDGTTSLVVTGIRIEEGATLTLAMNSDRNYSGTNDSSTLDLQNDIEILGVLRTASFDDPGTQDSGSSKDRGGFLLYTYGSALIRPSGIVSTAGMDAESGAGGHGGSIEIWTYRGESQEGGILLNQGSIDASGGSTTDADAPGGTAAYWPFEGTVTMGSDDKFTNAGSIRAAGGNGGTDGGAGASEVSLHSGLSLYNTGAISIDGGRGGSGNGGSGGSVQIASSGGSVFTSGPLSAKGGQGSIYGGNGGSVEGNTESSGSFLNSGTVDVGGGDGAGTDAATPTYGGSGGRIIFYCYGGEMISSGTLSADGGKGMNANAESTGGYGGYIDIESYPAGEVGTPAGRMEISNNLSARGGDGAGGGYGGYVYLYYGDGNGTGGIVLRGYGEIAGNGGNGLVRGGYGGYVYLYSGQGQAEVRNEAAVSVRGGGSVNAGGDGGYVEVYSSGPLAQPGAIAADGGAASSTDAGTYGGWGGYVYIEGSPPPSTYGSISVAPGTGGDPGAPSSMGSISIDGADATPADGTIP
jgi:hypothetical protein